MTDPERKHPIWSTVGITDHLRGSCIGLFRCSKCDRVPILRDASWGVPPPSHQVECTGCGMRGPRESTPEEAAAVWNDQAGCASHLRELRRQAAESQLGGRDSEKEPLQYSGTIGVMACQRCGRAYDYDESPEGSFRAFCPALAKSVAKLEQRLDSLAAQVEGLQRREQAAAARRDAAHEAVQFLPFP